MNTDWIFNDNRKLFICLGLCIMVIHFIKSSLESLTEIFLLKCYDV